MLRLFKPAGAKFISATLLLALLHAVQDFCVPAVMATETSQKLDVRSLSFPADKNLGAIFLLEAEGHQPKPGHADAQAKGDVKVTVPPNFILIFVPNQYAILHAQLLNDVSAKGIDAIKISFMSMEDTEDGMCDRALKFAPHFADAFRLDISQSDATDAGLSAVTRMPRLRSLIAASSAVRGTSLRTIDRFQHLSEIDLSNCVPFHELELKNLAKLPELSRLNYSGNSVSKEGLAHIAGCAHLETLNLSNNKTVNDDCVQLLRPLKHLKYLNLEQTSVGVDGLRKLAGMKLIIINLSRNLFTDSQVERVKKSLPGTFIALSTHRSGSKDSKIIFEPMLGHF